MPILRLNPGLAPWNCDDCSQPVFVGECVEDRFYCDKCVEYEEGEGNENPCESDESPEVDFQKDMDAA